MTSRDFYTGLPVNAGSSYNNDETEAANAAAFAKLYYDSGGGGPNQIEPSGGYGVDYTYDQNGQLVMLNGNPNPYEMGMGQGLYYSENPQYYQPPQQPVGIGYNPYMQSQMMYNQPQAPVQPMGNPAFQMFPNLSSGLRSYNNPYAAQQQQPVYNIPKTVEFHVKSVNISGDYLPPADWEQRVEDMHQRYFIQTQERIAEDVIKREEHHQNGFQYYNNFYGWNPWAQNMGVDSWLKNEMNDLIEEARENRVKLNIQLSRLCHNICRDDITDEQIEARYRGKTVIYDNPSVVQSYYGLTYDNRRLYDLVPFDNSQMYRDADAAVSAEFHKVIPKDSNLEDTFKNMGVLWAQWQMEDEMERRRNTSAMYERGSDTNAYKQYVRDEIIRKLRKEKAEIHNSGIVNSETNKRDKEIDVEMKKAFLSAFPLLSQCAEVDDDGVVQISLDLDKFDLSDNSDATVTVNEQEAEYTKEQEGFIKFLDSIPESLYDPPGGRKKARDG